MRNCFLVAFFLAITPSVAQIKHGTIIVIYYTKDKIIMAADSRVLRLDNNALDDTGCKISTPGGKLIFASSAVESVNSAWPVESWSNIDEIHRSYSTAILLYHTDRLLQAAQMWGMSIASHFQSLGSWAPEQLNEAAKKEQGVLTRAYIGGLNDNGELTLATVSVAYQPNGLSPMVVPVTQTVTRCPNSYCALGEIGIEQEFVNLTSQRAKMEAKKWKPPNNSNPSDYDILKTIRLVELTEKYGPEDVGGPIDAVELEKDGTLRWFAKKENCAAD